METENKKTTGEKENTPEKKTEPKEKNTDNNSNNSIAVIRVRGRIRLSKATADTLDMLGLYKNNYGVIINNNPSNMGMIKKVKDYITWGVLDEDTKKILISKTEKTKDKKGNEKLKKFVRLNPPKKGYGRKGIKKPFSLGGALGDRKEKINALIQRML